MSYVYKPEKIKIKLSLDANTIIVGFGVRKLKIHGKIKGSPKKFFTSLNAIDAWDEPFQNITIITRERKDIIAYIKKNSEEELKIQVVFGDAIP